MSQPHMTPQPERESRTTGIKLPTPAEAAADMAGRYAAAKACADAHRAMLMAIREAMGPGHVLYDTIWQHMVTLHGDAVNPDVRRAMELGLQLPVAVLLMEGAVPEEDAPRVPNLAASTMVEHLQHQVFTLDAERTELTNQLFGLRCQHDVAVKELERRGRAIEEFERRIASLNATIRHKDSLLGQFGPTARGPVPPVVAHVWYVLGSDPAKVDANHETPFVYAPIAISSAELEQLTPLQAVEWFVRHHQDAVDNSRRITEGPFKYGRTIYGGSTRDFELGRVETPPPTPEPDPVALRINAIRPPLIELDKQDARPAPDPL